MKYGHKSLRINPLTLAVVLSLSGSFPAWAAIEASGDVTPAPPPGSMDWTSPKDVFVGSSVAGDLSSPSGTLTISGGSKVSIGLGMNIGRLPGTAGRVDITDAGSELNITRALYVGNQGSGILNILNGAQVTSHSWGGNSGYIGTNAGTAGVVNVSGAGSRWTTDGTIDVGTDGDGTLVIRDGGQVDAGGSLWVGRNAGSKGTLLVTDGGILNIGANFLVGIHGNGQAVISNGGVVNSKVAIIGEDTDESTLLVTGKGSQLNTGEYLNVGQQHGTASMIVADGARITTSLNGSTPGRTNGMDIGFAAGDSGTVLITGKDSVINTFGRTGLTDPSSTNSSSVGKQGTGVLTLQEGGRLETHTLWLASEAGSQGTINIGGDKGGAATSAGYISTENKIIVGAGDGQINFNHTESDYIFASDIQGGSDAFTLNVASGSTTLTGTNDYQGTTLINGGELRAGSESAFSSQSDFEVAKNGQLALNDYSQTIASLNNEGSVVLGNRAAGAVLTISGDYTGKGGLLTFNSVLAGDDSVTDRLVVEGDTHGDTKVTVNNLGGSGNKTVNGIELIHVQGASAGEFSAAGRIVAGAYDYHLVRGEGSNAANWYLSNEGSGDGSGEGSCEDSCEGSGGGKDPLPVMILRPEGGAWTANLQAMNTLLNSQRDDRMGETAYTDAVTGEQKVTSMWMKHSGGQMRSHDDSGQLSTRSNRYSMLLGGDLASGMMMNGSTWRLGALAGYGNAHSTTSSAMTGARARGSVSGYTSGLYATWFAEGSSERGGYVDTHLQYSWFDASVSGDDLEAEKYHASGMSAGTEAGYVFAMNHSAGSAWFIQPKASLNWSGISPTAQREHNGTRVTANASDNISTALGIKTFMKGNSALDNGKQRSFKPFVEANWIHNTQNYSVQMDGVSITQAGARDIAELKAGVEGRITPQLNVTGYVTQQNGSHSYTNQAVSLGIKYSF